MVLGRIAPRLWLALTLLGSAAALVAAGLVLASGTAWDCPSMLELAGEPIHLRLDPLSAYFLALVGFVGALAAAYSWEYWPEHKYPDSAPRNRRWWSALLLTMTGVLCAANGLQFLIAWELFAISSFFLVTLDTMRREARSAGWVFLVASHAGTLCLFAFFTLLAVHTGRWELGPMRDHPELAPLFWLAFAGFGVKAGLFPLHIWLPSAHANAPSHVSAILSGVSLKLGIYGIVRFSGWLPPSTGAAWGTIAVGAITALFGIAFALGQNDYKRLLAYSSVENIGIIIVGLGAALLGVTHADAPWGRLALAGALLHVWNHGVFKSLLFFGAGSVLHATGTREMSRLGGLWRLMPWTTTLFGLGAVAVCALPPLNGFVSEWLIYLGLFGAAASRTSAAWVAAPAAILLGMTGAIALAAFVKAGAMIFLGAPRSSSVTHAHDAGLWMRMPMLIGAGAAMTLGLAPLLVWPVVTRVADAWHPWSGVAPVPVPLGSLTSVQITLAVLVGLGALVLWRVALRRGAPRRPTWDCGYARPTARMQYTSGSFGGIVAGWFRWVLWPEQELRRPRGLFPPRAYRNDRTPETVLERVLQPAARVVLAIAAAARRLQHGRLQFYVAYVVAGVLALAALAATGVKS